MKRLQRDLSRVVDGHFPAYDEGIGRNPLRTLRPDERLRLLADEGSLQLIRSEVISDRMGD